MDEQAIATQARECGSVLVLSAHHTGTWFTLDFLLGLTGAGPVLEMGRLVRGEDEFRRKNILHAHVVSDRLDSRGRLTSSAMGLELDIGVLVDAMLNEQVPMVVPIRDPLSAVISRHARHPGGAHAFIVHAFRTLPRIEGAVFLPIDIPGDDHLARLTAVAEHAGYKSVANTTHIERYAAGWEPHNTRGEYDLKVAYRDGDLEAVARAVPRAYGELIGHATEIITFLKSLGYPPMPWWPEHHHAATAEDRVPAGNR